MCIYVDEVCHKHSTQIIFDNVLLPMPTSDVLMASSSRL